MNRLRTLAVTGAIALSAPALAWPAEPQWNPQNEPAYVEGYRRGARAGAEDFRRGDRFQFQDESDYRRGDLGFRSQYGNRDRYRDSFRRGFEQGYRNGYGGLGAVPGRVVPRNGFAYEPGFNDGYEAGLNDSRGRRRYDPVSERRYRSADRGYDRRYGSKDAYKIAYRDAFKSGYDRGYQDGRRYDNRSRFGGFLGFLF